MTTRKKVSICVVLAAAAGAVVLLNCAHLERAREAPLASVNESATAGGDADKTAAIAEAGPNVASGSSLADRTPDPCPVGTTNITWTATDRPRNADTDSVGQAPEAATMPQRALNSTSRFVPDGSYSNSAPTNLPRELSPVRARRTPRACVGPTPEGRHWGRAPAGGGSAQQNPFQSGGGGGVSGATAGQSHAALGIRQTAPPGSFPSPDEELWIIQRPEGPAAAPSDDVPRCGTLMAKRPGEEEDISLPLEHTDVDAAISGYIATVEVTQQYHNPYESKIEAVYVFPLPQNAAVNDFLMTVGERRIRGIIREREEAQRIYDQAKRQGHVASLLTQERANIFTQSVANIEPGKQIDINIKYFNTLAYADGWYEFVFPMVVGPRFNPPGQTDGIGAVARGHYGTTGQSTEVPYLKPGERSGHDIALAVTIDAGVEIEQITSRSHVIEINRPVPERADVRLAALDALPNKDFVLRYRVAGETIKSALLTHEDERGGFFTLMVYPPAGLSDLPRRAMEMIFVLDCSGSMRGEPIAQAKTAIEQALHHLRPEDTFQIIRFSNCASQLGPAPVPATPENIHRGLAYLTGLQGCGGTMMIEGIKAALDFPHDESRLRFVSFMTDGYIGNEAQILGEVHDRLGASRIFSFGVGSSPNRYLLDRMAKLGNGAVAYLGLNDSAGEVMDAFFARVSHAAMTDLEIDWGGAEVDSVFPARVPDLFVGRPVILTGRYAGAWDRPVRVGGLCGDEPYELLIPVDADEPATASAMTYDGALASADAGATGSALRASLTAAAADADAPSGATASDAPSFGAPPLDGDHPAGAHPGLPAVWARMKIADLADRATYEPLADLPAQIKQVALDYNLMSAYTAFVAVDSLTRTAGDFGTTVPVAVPVPDGVRYETTVME